MNVNFLPSTNRKCIIQLLFMYFNERQISTLLKPQPNINLLLPWGSSDIVSCTIYILKLHSKYFNNNFDAMIYIYTRFVCFEVKYFHFTVFDCQRENTMKIIFQFHCKIIFFSYFSKLNWCTDLQQKEKKMVHKPMHLLCSVYSFL